MKLGVSYNIFDGEELLEGSIRQIRDQVDYISVVYQTISNFGNPCNRELVSLLNNLKEQGLVDELFEYKPKINVGGHFNEITKRNIGLSLSTGSKCTHHMSMDSDEYYLPEQFKFLKEEMVNGGYDSSYCQMRTYYKSWEYQLDPPEDYYVSLIYKVNNYSLFEMGKQCPVLVDPTRRMESGKYRIFKREEIEMHHGSYVRDNIRVKLENSSASVNFKNDIERITNHYENWVYPNKVLWGGLPSTLHNVKKVENFLNKKNSKINDFFEKIYCINIDRRVDRWESCLNEFKKHDLNVERFSATDGNINNYNLGYPYDNELAGAISHLNVIKKAKELNLKNVFILEDDVEFIDNLNNLFDQFIKQLPEDWDGINFGGNHIGGIAMIRPNVCKMARSYALHAYGINSKSYDTIINYMTNVIENVIKNGKTVIRQSVAADYFMADLHKALNFYCFRPHIAWQKEDYSDIQKTKVNYDFLK